MKYKEIVHMINDELKLLSDDSDITLEHIVFLCNKHRSYILKLEKTVKELTQTMTSSSAFYQTICMDLEEYDPSSSDICSDTILRSTEKVPSLISEYGVPNIVTPLDYYKNSIMFSFVTQNRMRFVGHNKWLENFIYCSIGPDGHLYLTSNNPQHKYLDKIRITAVFDDAEGAINQSCDCEDGSCSTEQNCDILEAEFPVEGFMVPLIVQRVVAELNSAEYRPDDEANNANDDLASIATYLRTHMKSNFQKQLGI